MMSVTGRTNHWHSDPERSQVNLNGTKLLAAVEFCTRKQPKEGRGFKLLEKVVAMFSFLFVCLFFVQYELLLKLNINKKRRRRSKENFFCMPV